MYNFKNHHKMKKLKHILSPVFAAILFVGLISCQGNTSMAGDTDESKVKEELQEIRDKADNLTDKIKNSTYAERKNLEDDINKFVSETEESLDEWEKDSKLENTVEDMVHNMREQTNQMTEELKEFGNKTEEQWEESTAKLESGFEKLGNNIEDFLKGNDS